MLLGLPEFELLSTDTVEETCALLSRHGAEAIGFRGRHGSACQDETQENGSAGVSSTSRGSRISTRSATMRRGGLRIGALTTIQGIEASSVIGKKFPALKQAAEVLGTTQIRNVGTIGGNLGNASPSAEFAPPLLTLGASVRCVGRGGERMIPLEEFFVSPGKTTLRQDELLTEVHVPDAAGWRPVHLPQAQPAKDGRRHRQRRGARRARRRCLPGRPDRAGSGGADPLSGRRRPRQLLRGRTPRRRIESKANCWTKSPRRPPTNRFPSTIFAAMPRTEGNSSRMLVGKGLERVIARARA